MPDNMGAQDSSGICPAHSTNLEEDPFDDFDGVHFTKNSHSADNIAILRADKGVPGQPTERRLSNAERGDLVYYPAPVPVMLNLPPKLTNNRSNSQAQTGLEDVRVRRESLNTLRRSLVLKASQSKADASSLFDNILDATVASPVLSVVNHSVSHGKLPGITGHTRSTSKFSLPMPRIEDTSNLQLSAHQSASSNSDDECGPHNECALPTTAIRNSVVEERIALNPHSHEDGLADDIPRAFHYPHSSHTQSDNEDEIQFVPATLLAELESRKNQQRARTNNAGNNRDSRQMPTLLERDAIAEVKHQARKRGPVNLGGQGERAVVDEEEDDVPLGVLFANKLSSRPVEVLRAPGLLAMREAEDNEPLRRRQERLKHTLGKEPMESLLQDPTEERETLGQRKSRLQAAQRQRDIASDRPDQGQDEPEASGPTMVGSMSAILHANPQRPSYIGQPDISSKGALSGELPFGYQAQQQMHISFASHQASNTPLIHQRKSMFPYQQEYTAASLKNRDYEVGIPFPYAPVNAEYLQHQQALLADQIERWRSSVW